MVADATTACYTEASTTGEALMPHIPPVGSTGGPSSMILEHRPEIRAAWEALDDALLGAGSTLPVTLKENVRRALATDLGCRYCASFGDPPADPADVAESLAIAFAELAAEDHRSIGAPMFETLREEFTEAQIVELCAWVCFKIGSNMLGAILGLDPSTAEQRREYEAMLADRAGAAA
jgi:alkylhydroperoxidase family enzyme